MRIGLLTTSFPRWEGDIAGNFVLGFARALAVRGHQLEVLAPEPAEPIPPPGFPGVDVHYVAYMRPRSAARTFYGAGVPDNLRLDPRAWLGIPTFCANLARVISQRRERWDALVSHWALPCGLLAGALRQGRPHLAVCHSADLHLLARLPASTRLSNQIARGASQLLFVSEQQRRRFLAQLSPAERTGVEMRAHVQPMGIDPTDAFAETDAPHPQRPAHDRFTLLTIGRLVSVKGLAPALQALAHRDDLTWLIAGDGPERARLEAIARHARMRVRLLGTVTGAAKHMLLRSADAFVLPSVVLPSGRSEGVPTALLEAMAHGLPVLAADVGGVREVVRDLDTGLLYPAGDARRLEAAIDRLRLEVRLRSDLAARARQAARSYTWPEIAPKLEALLEATS